MIEKLDLSLKNQVLRTKTKQNKTKKTTTTTTTTTKQFFNFMVFHRKTWFLAPKTGFFCKRQILENKHTQKKQKQKQKQKRKYNKIKLNKIKLS